MASRKKVKPWRCPNCGHVDKISSFAFKREIYSKRYIFELHSNEFRCPSCGMLLRVENLGLCILIGICVLLLIFLVLDPVSNLVRYYLCSENSCDVLIPLFFAIAVPLIVLAYVSLCNRMLRFVLANSQ